MAKKGKEHKRRDGSDGTDGSAGGAGEAGFLAGYDASEFPHPSLTVDVALVTASQDSLQALLLRREHHPEIHKWALAGGFVGLDESLDAAAARILREKVGLSDVFLEQLYTFGEPARDPRTRVITVAYYALVPIDRLTAAGVPGAEPTQLARLHVPWVGESGGPVEALDESGEVLPLAFDHGKILGTVVQRLRGKLDYAPVGFEFLPEVFSLRALQQVHEVISGRRFNKDSFRRRMLASGQLEATGEHLTDVEYRPPELYRVVHAAEG